MSAQMVVENYIDLKPDSALLDANFDGYKLSLDSFPCYSHSLKSRVRELQTSNAQFGLEHIKLFGDLNYLTVDHFYSDACFKRFVTVLEDFRLCSIVFNTKTRKFVVTETIPILAVPSNCVEIQDRYPATISFPDKNHAVVSNGYGCLAIYNTGNRAEGSIYEECLNVEPFVNGNGVANAFIVVESRSVENKFHILLRSILPRCSDKAEKANFLNKVVCLTVVNDDGRLVVSSNREVTCDGHLEMVTFDHDPGNIIIVGSGDIKCDASVVKREVGDEAMEGDDSKSVAKKRRYAWTQTATDVTVIFICAENFVKSDVNLSLSATSIHLSVKGAVLVGGMLGGLINPSSSTFTIDGNRLELFLCKATETTRWTQLVTGDDCGTYEVDPSALNTASELLELFTSESQVLSESGCVKNFNTEQMEECDVNAEDVCKIRWINVETETITHESDITGHMVLFSTAFGSNPRSLCLRMDVDGILWEFVDGSKKIVHKATFNALGYVQMCRHRMIYIAHLQSSKAQRRFSVCSMDCSYAAVIEAKQHAFIYWQPILIDSDLRNRKTGRRVADVAKQHLISLTKQSDFGDSNALNDNIVGVHADDKVLFILTLSNVVAVMLKENE